MSDKETVFDHPPTSEELIAAYERAAAADPTSPSYVRRLERPPLHLWRVLLSFLGMLAPAALLALVLHLVAAPRPLSLFLPLVLLLATLLLFAKRILIFFVKVYQRVAPARLRKRCRYEPSCSSYMILSLEKYGAARGLFRGIRRLRRCKPPHGGFDAP